jgi:hypothetical protein
MEDFENKDKRFDFTKCCAKPIGMTGFVDCLTTKQADFCNHSVRFADGYFCVHPCKKDFIESSRA